MIIKCAFMLGDKYIRIKRIYPGEVLSKRLLNPRCRSPVDINLTANKKHYDSFNDLKEVIESRVQKTKVLTMSGNTFEGLIEVNAFNKIKKEAESFLMN